MQFDWLLDSLEQLDGDVRVCSHSNWQRRSLYVCRITVRVSWSLPLGIPCGPSGTCQWSTSTSENSCGCTALDMLEWRDMTEQVDWWAKQPSQVAYFSEGLKCWGAWDITCGHKTKDVTPSIAWKREVWKEEVLDNLPWKGERGLSSVRRTLEPFQRQRWGNFWETGWSAHGLFWVHRYHLELNWGPC